MKCCLLIKSPASCVSEVTEIDLSSDRDFSAAVLISECLRFESEMRFDSSDCRNAAVMIVLG